MRGFELNLGTKDRSVRVILGLLIIAAGEIFHSWYGALGLIFLFTAWVGWCPVYAPFKISTRHAERHS